MPASGVGTACTVAAGVAAELRLALTAARARRVAHTQYVHVLVEELSSTRIGATFNQYAEGDRAAALRARLVQYLEQRADASLVLVGEAPGYRGTRVSGIPFTSERQLTGQGPAEASATIVHRVLRALGLEDDVLLWNVVPTHPGTAASNRPPTRAEVLAGLRFAERLVEGRRVVAVGRIAAGALGCASVRHPSHGGAAAFHAGLAGYARSSRKRARPSTTTSPRAPYFHSPA